MYMTVRQLFFRRLTHFHDFHVEVKGLSSQGWLASIVASVSETAVTTIN